MINNNISMIGCVGEKRKFHGINQGKQCTGCSGKNVFSSKVEVANFREFLEKIHN